MANKCSKMYGTDPLQHRIYLFIVTKKAKCCSGDVIYASVLYYNIYRKQSKSFNSLCNISICRPVVDVSVDFSLMKRYQTTCLFCFVLFCFFTLYALSGRFSVLQNNKARCNDDCLIRR